MQVNVRKICALDAAWIAESESICFADGWSAEMVSATTARADFCGAVLEVDGERAGYILGLSLFENAEVLRVAILPAWRRKGLGARLLQAWFAMVKEKGAENVLLEVRRSNAAARALYEGCGFVKFHERAHYYPDGEDALEMKKVL